jgi:GNAT superfamily N-acetyltransferase
MFLFRHVVPLLFFPIGTFCPIFNASRLTESIGVKISNMDSLLTSTSRLSVNAISSASAVSQFAQLLNQGFGVTPGAQFFDDFPLWDPALTVGRKILRLGVFQEDQLLAAAGVRIAQFRVSRHQTVPIAVIGGVVTHPEWRGLGLASQLVGQLVHWAVTHKACLAFLWGSEYQLYQRLGFELCGRQMRVPLDQLVRVRKGAGLKVHRGWDARLFSLLQKREGGLVLEAEDQTWFTAHRNVQWYWTENERKEPVSYAALGRGIDLHHLIHEWGGDTSGLMDIWNEVLSLCPEASVLCSPEHSQQLGIGAGTVEYLSMAKVLDPEMLWKAFHPHSPIEVSLMSERWHVKLGTETLGPMTHPELARIFLGDVESKGQPPGLPLPIWIWGLDAA